MKMKKLYLTLLLTAACITTAFAANKYDNPDTLFVARDGTAEFRNIDDAIEVCRAFMEYHKVIYVKKAHTRKSSSSPHGSPTSRYAEKTPKTPS